MWRVYKLDLNFKNETWLVSFSYQERIYQVLISLLYSDYLFKLVLIGDTCVGKSCLLVRFAVIFLNTFKKFDYSNFMNLGWLFFWKLHHNYWSWFRNFFIIFLTHFYRDSELYKSIRVPSSCRLYLFFEKSYLLMIIVGHSWTRKI